MYKRKKPKEFTGKEYFKNAKKKVYIQKLWQYAFSNLNSNVLRGTLAEFLVESALKNPSDIKLRNPWGDYDVISPRGSKIEVKCSSFLQDWDQDKLSTPVFSGLKAKELYWNKAVKGEKYDKKQKEYKSDMYVFVLLDHKDPKTLDILDMNQWKFYVMDKNTLKKISNDSSSISLAKLIKSGVLSVDFDSLRETVLSLE